MQAIVVDDDEGAPGVPVRPGGEDVEGDTVDSCASESADDKDTLLGYDLSPPLSPLSSSSSRPGSPHYILRRCLTSSLCSPREAARTELAFLPHPNAPKARSTYDQHQVARYTTPLPPLSPHPTPMSRKSPSPQPLRGQGGQGGPHPTIRVCACGPISAWGPYL